MLRCARMASAKRKLGLMLSTASAHPNLETAIGLSRQQAGPFVARGLSYLAINDQKSAASDLDGAVRMLAVIDAHPTSGGNAPAAPPITMFCGVVRFSHRV